LKDLKNNSNNNNNNQEVFKQLNTKLHNLNNNNNSGQQQLQNRQINRSISNNSIALELNNKEFINSPASSSSNNSSQSNLSNNNQKPKNNNNNNKPLFVISNKTSRASSVLPFDQIETNEIQQNRLLTDEDDIVIEPASKLGILVQTKVLEDKMNAFLTLLSENQLNSEEQRQVYTNITEDFDGLVANYEQIVQEQQSSEIAIKELDIAV
jgi:hypothetical protein